MLLLVSNKAGCLKIRLKDLISIRMEQVWMIHPVCELLLPILYVYIWQVRLILDKINKWADWVYLLHVNDAQTVLFFLCFNYTHYCFSWSSLHGFGLGCATGNAFSKQTVSITLADNLISPIFLLFWTLQVYYANNKLSWFFLFYFPHTFWSRLLARDHVALQFSENNNAHM